MDGESRIGRRELKSGGGGEVRVLGHTYIYIHAYYICRA